MCDMVYRNGFVERRRTQAANVTNGEIIGKAEKSDEDAAVLDTPRCREESSSGCRAARINDDKTGARRVSGSIVGIIGACRIGDGASCADAESKM